MKTSNTSDNALRNMKRRKIIKTEKRSFNKVLEIKEKPRRSNINLLGDSGEEN